MFHKIDYIAKRIVAYPLVAIGWVLTQIAQGFICCGAILLNHEDLL